jgi:hypothetical protein
MVLKGESSRKIRAYTDSTALPAHDDEIPLWSSADLTAQLRVVRLSPVADVSGRHSDWSFNSKRGQSILKTCACDFIVGHQPWKQAASPYHLLHRSYFTLSCDTSMIMRADK